MFYFYYILVFAAGIAIGWLANYGYGLNADTHRDDSAKAEDADSEHKKNDTNRGDEEPVLKTKKDRMNKLIEEIKKRERITNDEVQSLLGVSDSTATRYLNELKEEGILTVSGETRGIYYKVK